MATNVEVSLATPATAERLVTLVRDLANYPAWLDIVHAVTPDGGSGDTWRVELRGRVGPFARSKRLRMVRTEDTDSRVVFTRVEDDGRRHAAWVLTATVDRSVDGATLTMHLHYGGGLFGGVLERLLAEQIESGRARLLAELAD